MKNSWTLEDTQKLIDLNNKKCTIIEIAALLNRTSSSIYIKLRRLSIPLNQSKNPCWTKEQINILKNLNEKRLSVSEICKIFNKSKEAILSKLRKLKIEYNHGLDIKVSKQQKDRILSLLKENLPYNKIAEMVGKSEITVADVYKKNRNLLLSRESLQRKRYGGVENFIYKRFRQARLNKHKKYGFNFIGINEKYLFEIYKKQKGLCFYTKKPMVCLKNNLYSISIDRIDSSKGYVEGNIVLCCSIVNKMKNILPINDFIMLCESVSNNRNNINDSLNNLK